MKTVAILLDGGFIEKILSQKLKKWPTADQIYDFAMSTISVNEELFRIYYYNCLPFEGVVKNPITQQEIDFGQSQAAIRNKEIFSELSQKNYVAYRKGKLLFSGWAIDKKVNVGQSVSTTDYRPDFRQKEVDIKIGLDVAWLASKHIVNKIILVTADTDFIPAIKFARREGVNVVTIKVKELKADFYEHSDEIRELSYDAAKDNWTIKD